MNEVKKCEEMERILGEVCFHVYPFLSAALLKGTWLVRNYSGGFQGFSSRLSLV